MSIEVEEFWAKIEAAEKQRADAMPTERDAMKILYLAVRRLDELGWRGVQYCPKDMRDRQFLEAGSLGAGRGYRDEQGRIWLYEAGDLWPSKAILFKELPKETGAEEC